MQLDALRGHDVPRDVAVDNQRTDLDIGFEMSSLTHDQGAIRTYFAVQLPIDAQNPLELQGAFELDIFAKKCFQGDALLSFTSPWLNQC